MSCTSDSQYMSRYGDAQSRPSSPNVTLESHNVLHSNTAHGISTFVIPHWVPSFFKDSLPPSAHVPTAQNKGTQTISVTCFYVWIFFNYKPEK